MKKFNSSGNLSTKIYSDKYSISAGLLFKISITGRNQPVKTKMGAERYKLWQCSFTVGLLRSGDQWVISMNFLP